MTDPTRASSSSGKNRLAMIVAGCIAGLAVGLAGVYGIATLTRNAGGDPACRPAVELANKVAPFARGEVAAVNVAKSPLKVPDLAFTDAAGKPTSLADFRGRTVLLNLWATWCVPCRKEMPTLDALQGELGSKDFQVVAVNIDTRDPDKPKKFLKDIGVKKLKAIGRAFGMPTTMLIDPHGCEIGTVAGPAEWASSDAAKLIEAALKK
jgi:thiol-disulfide isomerase/thioredoxin